MVELFTYFRSIFLENLEGMSSILHSQLNCKFHHEYMDLDDICLFLQENENIG